MPKTRFFLPHLQTTRVCLEPV